MNSVANPTTETKPGPKPIRILLVEDNAGDVYLLEKTLQHRQLRYELTRFADGKQAIRAATGRERYTGFDPGRS